MIKFRKSIEEFKAIVFKEMIEPWIIPLLDYINNAITKDDK